MISLGKAYLVAGCLEEAQALAERLRALTRVSHERGHTAYFLRLLSDVAARCDPLASALAETHYREALALADELSMRPLQAHCHRGLGTLYATTSQREQARVVLSAALALYQAMEMTCWLPETEAMLAQVDA